MKIDLNQIEITSINNASGLFDGRNQHRSRSAVSKTNQGFGAVFQKTQITATVSLVNDNDWQDSFAVGQPAAWRLRHGG